MKECRITCVVPTHNSGATLEMALLSLLVQRDAQVNVIVADSGSTDATLEICQHWQIPVIYAEPGNMYRAINAGLRQSQTEWLMYLNSDDWLYPDALSRLIAHGEKTGAEVVYGHSDFVDDAGRFVYSMAAAAAEQILPLFRCRVMGFTPHSAIFRRAVYERFDGFDEAYALSSDADFFVRLICAGVKFAQLSGPPVACFRLHEQQQTQTKAAAMNAERARIYNAEKLQPGWRDRLALAQWRVKNLPHYLLRIVRASLLACRVRFPGSMEPWRHF
jgi:GT2 family glycosyltransferase